MSAPVALLTDFGLADPYVAEMKAALLRGGVSPGRLLDLGHAVAPGDVAAAAWFLGRVWAQLPAGTVHLAVVDPGVGTARPAVAATAAGHAFVAPGNGLLGFLAGRDDLAVVRLGEDALDPPPGRPPSTTFHGRDLFAPAAARLAVGESLGELGDRGDRASLGELPAGPPPDPGTIGSVVWIDRFGNLITDVAPDGAAGRTLAAGAVLQVGAVQVAGPWPTFGAAPAGRPFWYWGSGGTLEIAVPGASAAARLGAGRGLALRVVRP